MIKININNNNNNSNGKWWVLCEAYKRGFILY